MVHVASPLNEVYLIFREPTRNVPEFSGVSMENRKPPGVEAIALPHLLSLVATVAGTPEESHIALPFVYSHICHFGPAGQGPLMSRQGPLIKRGA